MLLTYFLCGIDPKTGRTKFGMRAEAKNQLFQIFAVRKTLETSEPDVGQHKPDAKMSKANVLAPSVSVFRFRIFIWMKITY